MKTCCTLCLIRVWFLALVFAGAAAAPSLLRAADSARATTAVAAAVPTQDSPAHVLPAAWYDHILDSRARTVQAVGVLVLFGAFLLRRAS